MAPPIAERDGARVFAVDLPAYGLIDGASGFADNLRPNAVEFLERVRDGLGLQRSARDEAHG